MTLSAEVCDGSTWPQVIHRAFSMMRAQHVRVIWTLQGEFEEARSIMKKMGAENKLMHSILAQGKNLVGKLQEAIPSGEGTSPKVNQHAVMKVPETCSHMGSWT